MKIKAKYYPLYKFLASKNTRSIMLTKEQIEEILGFSLPKSSQVNSWWTNAPENGHYHAYAWIEAGFVVKILGIKIVFSK
jgi:hypothetical protein